MDTTRKLELLARAGYAARGLVYLLVGLMAILGSLGGGSPDSKSALQLVLGQPLGRVWLGIAAIAMVGFILWRLLQALGNADHHPDDLKGYVVRAGLLVSAATYGGLAIFAARHALNLGGQASGDGSRSWTAWLMQQPFGRYLVAFVALCILGAGVAHIVKALTRGYHRYLSFDARTHSGLDLFCVYGLVAKGCVFLIISVFFFYAAFTVDPDQAGSMADALSFVRQLPFGAILYVLMGLGLCSFGFYSFIEARYRRVVPPSLAEARSAMPI
ncbi:DUF1206 domain-containing protein [Rhizobium helianthi]|uniref:DUF1206 domain-containing protein n=1 Tax=Rhizobium helianthi TaxID=1132695 RepID=A0ABW4LZH0_9HYPH